MLVCETGSVVVTVEDVFPEPALAQPLARRAIVKLAQSAPTLNAVVTV